MTDQELQGLKRVLDRLAVTDDEKLETVLEKLLPICIGKLETPRSEVRQHVLAILSHVNKRLQALPHVQLPVSQLLELYCRTTVAIVHNFSLLYIERGMERAPSDTRLHLVPLLLKACSLREDCSLLRLTVFGLQILADTRQSLPQSQRNLVESMLKTLPKTVDMKPFLDFARIFMLYRAQKSEEAHPPPGLSSADVEAIQGKTAGPLPNVTLQQQKLGILNFTKMLDLSPLDVFGLYVIAASDPLDVVCQRGEDLLKSLWNSSNSSSIDLENDRLVIELMTLFLGKAPQPSGPQQEATTPRSPIAPALRSRLLSLFCQSVKAANTLPGALMVVSESVFDHPVPKVQRQGMEFAVWVVKHADQALLTHDVAPSIFQSCLSLVMLRDDSNIKAARHQEQQLGQSSEVRAFAYQTLGQLARRAPTAFAGRLLEIAKLCFEGLVSEPSGVRDVVAETAHVVADALKKEGISAVDRSQVLEFIHPFLMSMSSGKGENDAVRSAALHWITSISPEDDVQARYACIMASADPNPHIARSALDAIKFVEAMDESEPSLPTLPDMLQYITACHPMLASPTRSPDFGAESETLPLPPTAWLSAIKVLEACRTSKVQPRGEASGEYSAQYRAAAYLDFLEHALVRSAPSDLHRAALSTFLRLYSDAEYRTHVEDHLVVLKTEGGGQGGTAPIERLLASTDITVRELSGRLLGVAASKMKDDQIDAMIDRIFFMQYFSDSAPPPFKKRRFEELDGSLRAIGFVLAGCCRVGQPCSNTYKTVTDTLIRFVSFPPKQHPNNIPGGVDGLCLRAVAARSLGYASLCCSSLHRSLTTPPYSLVTTVFDDLVVVLRKGSLAGKGISSTSAGKGDGKNGDSDSSSASWTRWTEQVTIPALHALALLAFKTNLSFDKTTKDQSSTNGLPSFTALLTQHLFSDDAKSCTHQKTVLAIGEVLCFVFGVNCTSIDVLLTTPPSSMGNAGLLLEARSRGATEEMDEDLGNSGSLHEPREEFEQEMEKEKLDILDAVINMASHSRKEVRASGATWLVSILLYCRESLVRLLRRHHHSLLLLPRIHAALTNGLLDESEAVQDMAARGMGVLYYDVAGDLASDVAGGSIDEQLQKEMISEFIACVVSGSVPNKRRRDDQMAASNHNSSSKHPIPSSKINASSPQVLVYKELCSMATNLGPLSNNSSIGRVVVALLLVSQDHHRQASAHPFGGGESSLMMQRAVAELRPHLPAIIPRLYRLLYDPLPHVRDALQRVWVVLVDEPKAAVTLNFASIMASLCKDMTGPTWRGREAAALAAADCLSQRQWDVVAPFFAELWVATFRVMDDVKESVRTAGLALVRALRGFTLRVAAGTSKNGEEPLKIALPFLLTQGLGSSVPEVKSVSLDTLTQCISLAGQSSITPLLPTIVPPLLEALSGLEDTRLNYVEQHAERWGIDPSGLDVARTAASKEGPLAESLDLCAKYVNDGDTFGELAPQLASIVRRGVGIVTKCGTGRFVAKAVDSLKRSDKWSEQSYTDRPTQKSVTVLLKAFQETIFQEKSSSVRSSYATAFASLLHLVSVKKGEATLTQLLESNILSQIRGVDDSEKDGIAEKVCGALFLAVAVECKDLFARMSNDIAPVAFVLSQESEDSVWNRLWDECSTSLRLHVPGIVHLADSWLRSSNWGMKNRGARAITAVATSPSADALCRLCNPETGTGTGRTTTTVTETLLSVTSGRLLWEGAESALRAVGTVVRACITYCDEGDEGKMDSSTPKNLELVNLLVNVAGSRKKKKVVYRQEALEQLRGIVTQLNKGEPKRGWGSIYGTTGDMLLQACDSIIQHRTGTGLSETRDDQEDVLFVHVLGVMEALFSGSASAQQNEWLAGSNLDFVKIVSKLLPLCRKPSEQAAVLDAAFAIVCATSSVQFTTVTLEEEFKERTNEFGNLGQEALRLAAPGGKGLVVREKSIALLSAIMVSGAIQPSTLEKWRQTISTFKSEEKVESIIAAFEKLL